MQFEKSKQPMQIVTQYRDAMMPYENIYIVSGTYNPQLNCWSNSFNERYEHNGPDFALYNHGTIIGKYDTYEICKNVFYEMVNAFYEDRKIFYMPPSDEIRKEKTL